MDEGIVQIVEGSERKEVRVLILVVVEDGLVLLSRSLTLRRLSLNPYCSGRWSRTQDINDKRIESLKDVLILVVVDDGLVLTPTVVKHDSYYVLILVVVDDGLVQFKFDDVVVNGGES